MTIYRIDNQERPTVQHRELYSICCNNLKWKIIWKRIHIIETLCCTVRTKAAFFSVYLFGCLRSWLWHGASFTAVNGLCGCGAHSVVGAPRLSFSMACGFLVPQPGIEPVSPALQGGFLTTEPLGKSQHCKLTILQFFKKL